MPSKMPRPRAPPLNAAPSNPRALKDQPDKGKILGFDFYRDPLNAKKPMEKPEDITAKDIVDRPAVMEAQKKLLESRYNLTPKLDNSVKMSRGKPLAVGPTAKLKSGATFDSLANMSPDEIKKQNAFPYPSLPHPKHVAGGMVFPSMQIEMFPRLERFDVEIDLPEAFLPEFPPAIFLINRPELGDVSQGEVVSINNFIASSKTSSPPSSSMASASSSLRSRRRSSTPPMIAKL